VRRLRRRGTASNRGAYTVQTSMGMGFAMVTEEEGISVTSAEVGGFTVSELRFPKSYVQPPFEPELPYIAVVLEGALVKSFPRQALELGRYNAVTIPVGATRRARFGSSGALIVIVRSRSASEPVAGCLDRVAELRARELTRLGLCARRDRRSARDPGRNRAKIGGIVTQSSDPTIAVGMFGFQVFDNGEDANAPPDQSSLVGFGGEAANEAFCNSPNLHRFGPWDVQGNVQVRTR
jgi:hypothetical protein